MSLLYLFSADSFFLKANSSLAIQKISDTLWNPHMLRGKVRDSECYFCLESTIKIPVKLANIMGTQFTKLR